MLEKSFQTQVKRSFDMYCHEKNIEGEYHKYGDYGFRTKYDCFFKLYKSRFIACELKVNRQKNTFNFKALFGYGKQYHEIVNLKKDVRLGNTGWVIIAHKGASKQFRAFALNPEQADNFYRCGSVQLEAIEEFAVELPRKHRGSELLYDLSPIL